MKYNIDNKEEIMKSNSAVFLQSSFRGAALPVLMAVCLSFAGTASAQEKTADPATNVQPPAEKNVASEAQTAANTYEKELQDQQRVFTDKLGKAAKRAEEKKFDEAMALFAETEADIAKLEPGKLKEVLTEKLNLMRDNYRHEYAEELFREAQAQYIEMLKEKKLEKAAELSEKVQETLTSAQFMYYFGTLKGDTAKLEEASKENPQFAQRAKNLLADCEKIQSFFNFKQETSMEAIDPDFKNRKDRIDKLYLQGEKLYRDRQYELARNKMEEVIVEDPYNEKAIALLSRIYRKLYAIADLRQYNELLNDQAMNEWRWMDSVTPASGKKENTPVEYRDPSSPLFDKLKNIKIPSISFDGTDINGAVKHIQRKSVENDTMERSGININLKLKNKDGVTDPAIAGRTVTFSLKNVPLLEVIRYFCLSSGLKYRVDEKLKNVVIGTPEIIMEGENMDNIEIPIRHATILRMLGEDVVKKEDKKETKELSIEDGLELDLETTFSEGIASGSMKRGGRPKYSEALKQYFQSLGFTFGPGTFVAYDSRQNRMLLKNTPDILRKLESLVTAIDIETPLVLIEAKIVEISMNDLEELGFDWTLTHESDNPRWTYTITSPIRSSPNTNNILINNMNVMPNFGPDNSWNLFLTVNAVDRVDRAEILSTPKIISKNGMAGRIRMVRQMYFPESWSEPEINTSCGSSVSVEPSYPEFGDAKDVGIIFEATPSVSSTNHTINLTLNPQIVDLVGWSDYSYDLVFGEFKSSTQAIHVVTKMPEMSVRQVETQVKVYDGQTIVIGGMLNDKQTSRDDRWPILGDLPLVGRLFSQRYCDIVKSNLLISVTSRLIRGDGRPIQSYPNGLPDFHR